MDLDGFISGCILKHHFMGQTNGNVIIKNGPFDKADLSDENRTVVYSRPYNYGDKINIDEMIEAVGTHVKTGAYFVDCSPSQDKECFQKLYTLLGGNLIIIDHHISAIKHIKEFEEEAKCIGRNPCDISGLRDVKFSGCELTYMYMHNMSAAEYDAIPRFIRYLGRYDIHDTSSSKLSWEDEILPFQYGFRSIVPDLCDLTINNDIVQYLLCKYFHDDTATIYKEIINEGKAALDYIEDRNSKILKEYGHRTKVKFLPKIRKEFISYDAYWVTDYFNNSMVFGKEYNDSSLVYITIQHDISKDVYKITLYSTEESKIDVSEIATGMGGGGHKHAAGFIASNVYLNKVDGGDSVLRIISFSSESEATISK
jgi:oligoribonuclease NrnB/cAMP/cGMP phosphodiesterase (DHH superfamily)